MRNLGIFAILIIGLSACCGRIYEPYYYENALQINLHYGHKGFDKSDTVFEVTFYYNRMTSNGSDSFMVTDYTNDLYYTQNVPDSARQIAISTFEYYKIKIKSLNSSFQDSITNIGYSYRQKYEGNRRCGYNRKIYFDVHGTYKNKTYNSGSDPSLAILVKPHWLSLFEKTVDLIWEKYSLKTWFYYKGSI